MTPIDDAESILRNIEYILTAYPANYNQIGELDKELCDIQHMIEFTPIDIQRGFRFAKQTKEARVKRRQLKDENELLKPLYDFLMQGTTHKRLETAYSMPCKPLSAEKAHCH